MKMKTTNPNQRIIKIEKAKTDMENIYTKLNIEASNYALENLSPNGFKLWFYFAKNDNNYEMLLFRVHVTKECKMSENTYRAAFKELVEKGFLVQAENSKSYYNFYEKPKSEFEMVKIHKKISKEIDELSNVFGDIGYVDTSENYAPEEYEFAI